MCVQVFSMQIAHTNSIYWQHALYKKPIAKKAPKKARIACCNMYFTTIGLKSLKCNVKRFFANQSSYMRQIYLVEIGAKQ